MASLNPRSSARSNHRRVLLSFGQSIDLKPENNLSGNQQHYLLWQFREVVRDEIKLALENKQIIQDQDHSSACSNNDGSIRRTHFNYNHSQVNHEIHELRAGQEYPGHNEAGAAAKEGNPINQQMGPPMSRNGRQRENADLQECYSNALQVNLEKLVDVLDFRDSILPDILITDGYITENESQNIRSLPDRKDQVRALFSIIKGRDKRVLKALYDFIQKNHGDSKFANDIKEKFEQNIKDNLNSKICVTCKIKKTVNIKYVIDGLFAHYFITDGLYNDCLWTDKHTGSQDSLWNRIFDALNDLLQQKNLSGYETLMRILEEKNHYCHIAADLKICLRKLNQLVRCTCKCEWPLQRVPSVESFVSSVSPGSYDSERGSCHSHFVLSDEEQENTGEAQSIAMESHGPRINDENREDPKITDIASEASGQREEKTIEATLLANRKSRRYRNRYDKTSFHKLDPKITDIASGASGQREEKTIEATLLARIKSLRYRNPYSNSQQAQQP